MEATGVYHESLAYYLCGNKKQVSIVLPNKISNYVRTLDIKTITDKSASQAIARFGLERQLEIWQPPLKIFNDLRQLCREREQLVQERTMLKNQLHAERSSATSSEKSIKRTKKRIAMIDKQEKEIRDEIAALIKGDEAIAKKMKVITSIPEKTSGTSVKSKPRISKRGNRNLRKVMHFPALAAIRTDESFRYIFLRLVSRHGIKMKAIVAIQRKLLELTYILWKSNTSYCPNYHNQSLTIETTTI